MAASERCGWRRLRVPASSANLGPGFDALGLALGIYLECRFRPSPGLAIRASGRDASLISLSDDNLIWQTAVGVARAVRKEAPAIELAIHNEIPIGKGLGSSAAAHTAGVVIANELLDLQWSAARILDEAARLEGHPDNVAACVFGSVVATAVESNGTACTVRLELPESFGIAVVVPDFRLPTSQARSVLPDHYSRNDAIFNIQRAALLVAALAAGSTRPFPTALQDRLHQPYRLPLVPGMEEILQLRAPGLLGCCLSGAGPSILVFYERGSESVCELVRRIFRSHGCDAQIIQTEVARHGYELTSEVC